MSFNTFSQTSETKVIAKSEIKFDWVIEQSVTNGDTSTYFYWRYRNLEYQYITDYGSIFITSKDKLIELGNKLIELGNKLPEISSGERISVNIDKNISLTISSITKNVYVYSDNKYTYLPKKASILLGEEIIKYAYLLE